MKSIRLVTTEFTKPNSLCKKKMHIYVMKDDTGLILHVESVEIKNARGEWERAHQYFDLFAGLQSLRQLFRLKKHMQTSEFWLFFVFPPL